jgi:hypothetical protein
MLVIKLNARNQRLNRYTSAVVVPNSYSDLKLQFNFITEDWQSVTKKVANFSYKSYSESVEVDENNLCAVPVKVVRPPYFYVSVDGFVGDNSIVTNKIKIFVDPNDKFDGDVSGVVYVPEISEDKILSWTNNGGLENPDPVDLNPFDDWTEDGDVNSEYEWEDDI